MSLISFIKLAKPRYWWLWITLIFLAGCYPSALQQDYGQAWSYNLTVQILNPTAGQNDTPATGLSPQAGTKVMESYNKAFERKEETKVPVASLVPIGKEGN